MARDLLASASFTSRSLSEMTRFSLVELEFGDTPLDGIPLVLQYLLDYILFCLVDFEVEAITHYRITCAALG